MVKKYKVKRTIEYTGSFEWIWRTLENSTIQPGEGIRTLTFSIQETDRTEPQEVIEKKEEEGTNGN